MTPGNDMSDLFQGKPPIPEEEDSGITIQREPSPAETANLLRQATGLDLRGMTTGAPPVRPVSSTADPNSYARPMSTTAPVGESLGGGMRMLTPEEAAQLGIGGGQKVEVSKLAEEAMDERVEREIKQECKTRNDMFENALKAEADRLSRTDQALKSEDVQEELKGAQEGKKVRYDGINTDGEVSREETDRRMRMSEDAYDDTDLMPSYNAEDPTLAEEDAKKEKKTNAPRPDTPVATGDVAQDEKMYSEYIRSLETVKSEENQDYSVVQTVRSRVTDIVSERGKTKILGDQAFVNSITKFKKDNFRSVSVPLVNSGFSVDMVGTSATDLVLLYTGVDENTMALDYELEKMRTVIKNVVGTSPKIAPDRLRNLIHFIDYQLMAFAHIVATLDEIDMLQSCPECGNDFHIIANSQDLIVNMDELRDRMAEIKTAESWDRFSLLSMDRVINTTGGFEITLGHPSYNEYVNYLSAIKELTQRRPEMEVLRIRRMQNVLPYVRIIKLPNGVQSNNLYQKYLGLTLLSQDDLKLVQEEVAKMVKKIIAPRFGLRKITCPHCHRVIKDVTYESLNELLFFHTTVSRLMETPSTSESEENG